MRLDNYLIEQEESEIEETIQAIKRDCKPYLKESRNQFLFRGTKKPFQGLMITRTPRQDRRPLGTPPEWHNWADNYLLNKFGWRGRSQGVFVAGEEEAVRIYGGFMGTYLVFPIGPFEYIWSPLIRDFTAIISFREFRTFKEDPAFNKRVMDFMKSYTNKNLHVALSKHPGNEVMIRCKKYYQVKSELQYRLKGELS